MKSPLLTTRLALALCTILLTATSAARAQANGCGDGQAPLNPGRPSVSNAATTTACGHLEMDHGWTTQRNSDASHTGTLNATLRFGLTRTIDIQWSFDEFSRLEANGNTLRGIGDNWFAARYRFHDQSRYLPALGIRYSVKAPTAPVANGGTGFADHQLSVLVSRDVRKLHLDYNFIENFYGTGTGSSSGAVSALAATAPITPRVAWLTESYGGRQADGSLFASQYFGTLIAVNPTFVLDLGIDKGLTASAPSWRFVVGLSYSIGRFRSSTNRVAARRPLN